MGTPNFPKQLRVKEILTIDACKKTHIPSQAERLETFRANRKQSDSSCTGSQATPSCLAWKMSLKPVVGQKQSKKFPASYKQETEKEQAVEERKI